MSHHPHVKTIIGNGLYPLIVVEDPDFAGTYTRDHAERIAYRLHHRDPLAHAIERAIHEIREAVESVSVNAC